MKSRFKLWMTIALAILATFLTSGIAAAFQAGDKVEIEYGGAWYPGNVKEAKAGQFFISYDDYDSSWDEWVESERLRVPETAEEGITTDGEEAVSDEETATGDSSDETVADDEPQEITIRKGGSIWATVSPDGTIRVNGSIEGEVEENGNVRVSGMNSGEIDAAGAIRKGGMIAGAIESDGTLRANGSIVGSVDADGTLRRNGSIWGEADASLDSARNRNAVTAVLVFFAGSDFGF